MSTSALPSPTPAPALALDAIGQIAIIAHDIDRAIAFYRDTLGIRFMFQAGTLAFFNCGGIRLMLTVPENAEFDYPASVLYYRVADLDAAHETLVSRGVTFFSPPHLIHKTPAYELWMAFCRDSEGNPLALMQEKGVVA